MQLPGAHAQGTRGKHTDSVASGEPRRAAVTMARSRFNDPIEPMTLQNMRENGVRSLSIQCHQCRHQVVMNVDHLRGDMTVPSFGRPSTSSVYRHEKKSPALEGRGKSKEACMWARWGSVPQPAEGHQCLAEAVQ